MGDLDSHRLKFGPKEIHSWLGIWETANGAITIDWSAEKTNMVSMNFQAGLCWLELVSNVGITKEVLPVKLVKWGHQHISIPC